MDERPYTTMLVLTCMNAFFHLQQPLSKSVGKCETIWKSYEIFSFSKINDDINDDESIHDLWICHIFIFQQQWN